MIGSKSTIEEELSSLSEHFDEYTSTLNAEAIWLFLATLGCWSVSEAHIRYIAYGVAAYLFGHRFLNSMRENRSFKTLIQAVKRRIESHQGQPDYIKARQFELAQILESKLSKTSAIKRNSVFILCWCFFAVSIGYTIYNLPKP